MALSRSLFIMALALTAVAASSEYTDDELTMISHQVELCLRDLPVIKGDFATQIKDACGMKAWLALYEVPQQELTPVVVRCLQGYSQVSRKQVSTAQQCLVNRLAKNYHDFKMGYSSRQRSEILGRVSSCLQMVPDQLAREECRDRALSSLLDGAWKEDEEDNTARCLQNANYSVSDEVVAAAKQCLRQQLDKDLTTN